MKSLAAPMGVSLVIRSLDCKKASGNKKSFVLKGRHRQERLGNIPTIQPIQPIQSILPS